MQSITSTWTPGELKRWKDCPKYSKPFPTRVRNLALRVCKVPLSEAYTDDLEDEKKAEDTATFSPETVIEQCYADKLNPRLVIDATFVQGVRLHDADLWDDYGAELLKLRPESAEDKIGAVVQLDAMPPVECVKIFVSSIKKLGKQVSKIGNVGHPFLVLVFGTLGFHHAAVLVVSYLVTVAKFTLENALAQFAHSHPPGIYSQPLLRGLAHMLSRPSPLGPITTPAWERHVPRLAQTRAKPLPKPPKMAEERANTASASKTAATVSNIAARRDKTTGNPGKGVVAINRCLQLLKLKASGAPGRSLSPPCCKFTSINEFPSKSLELKDRKYWVAKQPPGSKRALMLVADGDATVLFTAAHDRSASGLTLALTFYNRKKAMRPFSAVIVDGFLVHAGVAKPTFWVADVLIVDTVPMFKEPLLKRLQCIQNDLIKPLQQSVPHASARTIGVCQCNWFPCSPERLRKLVPDGTCARLYFRVEKGTYDIGPSRSALTWEGDAPAARCLGTSKRKRAALVVASGAQVNKHTVRPFKDSDASVVRALFQKGMTAEDPARQHPEHHKHTRDALKWLTAKNLLAGDWWLGFWVAVDESDKVVGMIGAAPVKNQPTCAEVRFLQVALESRRSGVGAQLVRHMERFCKSKCMVSTIILRTLSIHNKAINLYQKLGYCITRRRKQLTFETVTMERAL